MPAFSEATVPNAIIDQDHDAKPWISHSHSQGVHIMKLLTDLFSTDYGLMSIMGIMFMIGMGVFFLRLFMGKMDADAKNAGK
ncbi:DUF3149 domain-containing protein [Polaromonas sp.]|jgi:hypothetical protein|uniref:DUF3149 domain-containing protein n=1 Tax=Polaromonas sp. TaxID=1869339 RepID=UPI003BB536C7